MTMYFGSAYLRITEAGALMINAPGGTTITTPSTKNTGTLTTEGLLTYQAGMAGTGGSAGTTITGNVSHVGDYANTGNVTSNGITLHTHTHTGVQPGGGSTGAPQ
jgi:phage baseplate assembly protein V